MRPDTADAASTERACGRVAGGAAHHGGLHRPTHRNPSWVVVRLYEAHGGRARARLVPGFEADEIVETDLLERPLAQPKALVDPDGTLALRPFQLVTLRLRRRHP
ncbi:glycosyl hydrolase-related protein [Humibacillus xanthopallidus]|uniref:glycosyl hydrolase-related protein n=1 Tax=Humibacillus xanthopallidus TaxID=412689 RepID=UPI00163A1084|nr:glycosyl hydrolase-related protein [Humibacillus xanthopallidus]